MPLERYADNLRALARLARARGAVPVFLAPPYARPSLEPYFAASRHRTPVARYREAMREVAREEEAVYVNVPLLNERLGSADPRLFVTRPLAPAEREGFRLLGLAPERRDEMGLSLDLRARTDLAHPSAAGHALLAEALADPVRRNLPLVPP